MAPETETALLAHGESLICQVKKKPLVSWQCERKKEDRVTNKSCLLVRVSIAIRMEGRRVKEIPETDKQVEKGTSGS